MSCVVRLYAVRSSLSSPSVVDGLYLHSFDAEAYNGRGHTVLTPHLSEARVFANVAEVLALRNAVPKCHPVRRSDGLPNRPLSAYHIEIESLSDAAAVPSQPMKET